MVGLESDFISSRGSPLAVEGDEMEGEFPLNGDEEGEGIVFDVEWYFAAGGNEHESHLEGALEFLFELEESFF